MNKRCYRVVFNKTRGLLMAVCELARSHGAAASGGLAFTSSVAHLPLARLHPLAFAVLLLSGVELILIPSTQAQIVADRSAPRSQQPVVLNTASGLPQVNITTPSAAGVSRNTYTQFDVNKPGAILNNARSDVQTQLGGWVQRNPNLATGTARMILNEVNSANPSLLRGYVEVAGDRAQVVIANPSGITCDGCGFINASRTTLTTGTAVMNGGNLDAFVVRRGTVTVQGDGLDASQSDYTHIIARAARINAGIWSRELRVTTGANRVDVNNQVIQKQDAADIAPSFSIDVAQLGGMYANKILLVGTEAGVGVRNAGNIGAAAGEVRINAAGHIENTGKIQATQSASIDLESAGTLRNDGLIQAATLLKLKARTIMNGATGTLVGNRLQLNATDAHTLINRGLIDGQDTFITTQALRNLGTGRIYGDHVAIAAATIDNEAETLNGATSAPLIAARDRLDIGAENLNNREHALIFAGGEMAIGGALDSNNRATGQAGTVNNNSASIEAQGRLDISSRKINNTNEHFSTEVVEVSRESKREFQYSGSSARYDNSQVAIINDEADDMWLRDGSGNPSVKLGNDFNRYDFTRVVTETRVKESDPGKIRSGLGMRINAAVLNNDKSQIMAGGTLTGTIGTLNNTEVPGQRTITDAGTAFHFYNIERKGRDEQGISSTGYYPGAVVHGALLAADSVNLKITDAVNNSGTIAGRNLLTIDAATINNNGGRLTAKDATVVAALDVNNIGGTIDAGDKLSVSAGRDLNLVSTTRDSATDQATRTSVERVAALYVANAGGTLTATAARDINAKAAQIANSGAGGSTTLAAGNNVNLDTVAEKSSQSLKGDIDILAKKISILAATDSERNTQDMVFKQTGLTLQITSPVLSAIQTVQQMKKAAESTSDGAGYAVWREVRDRALCEWRQGLSPPSGRRQRGGRDQAQTDAGLPLFPGRCAGQGWPGR